VKRLLTLALILCLSPQAHAFWEATITEIDETATMGVTDPTQPAGSRMEYITVENAVKTSVDADDIDDTATTKKFATAAQLTAIATNSDKTGITSGQAAAIVANTDKETNTDDQTAAEVTFTPGGTVAATDVQAAILEVASEASATGEANETMDAVPTDGNTDHTASSDGIFDAFALKAPLASPTFTGTVNAAAITASGLVTATGGISTGPLSFEGSAVDGNDTTFSVVNPTADRTITLGDFDMEIPAASAIHSDGTILDVGIASTIARDSEIVSANTNQLTWYFNATQLEEDATAPTGLMIWEIPTGAEWTTGELVCDAATEDLEITVAYSATPLFGSPTNYTTTIGSSDDTSPAESVTVTGWADPTAGTNVGAWVSAADATGTATYCKLIVKLENN